MFSLWLVLWVAHNNDHALACLNFDWPAGKLILFLFEDGPISNYCDGIIRFFEYGKIRPTNKPPTVILPHYFWLLSELLWFFLNTIEFILSPPNQSIIKLPSQAMAKTYWEILDIAVNWYRVADIFYGIEVRILHDSNSEIFYFAPPIHFVLLG